MKNLLMIVALLALAAPAKAASYYVAVATWTAGGTGTNAVAFQNTDSGRSVRVLKIEVSNVSNSAITGGVMQFWVMGATVATAGGTSQVSFYDTQAANVTAPSYVSFSTGPVGVVFEGKQTRQLPIARPLIVNDDEAATISLWDSTSPSDYPRSEFLLPAGSNRAIVLRQMQLGATDFTAGILMARIFYTIE